KLRKGEGTLNWGAPLQWSEVFPKVGSAAPDELEMGQRMILKFFQSHSLEWCLSNGGLLPKVVEEHWLGEASSSSTNTRPLTGGSLALTPYQSNLQAREEERSRKKKLLAKVGHEGKELTILDDEEERLAKQEEVDLQAGLPLSHEEACHLGLIVMFLKAAMEPIHLGPSSLFVYLANLDKGALSPTPSPKKETSETPTWVACEDAEARGVVDRGPMSQCCADLGEVGLSVGKDAENPWRPSPYAIEESRGKSRLVPNSVSGKRGTRAGRADADQFGMSRIISEEECQKSVAVRKCPEESGVAQVTREVLRHDASFLSTLEYLEESVLAIWWERSCGSNGSDVGLKVLPRGSDASSFNFLRWVGEQIGRKPCEKELKRP
ncbi:hypothetical protein ACLOJK_008937, partial [Asimina triloba]